MAEAYTEIIGGSLKLKGLGKQKKKKKKNKAKEVMETIDKVEEKRQERREDTRTAAQKSFDDIQKRRQKEKIMEKAKKTHKQRVEELNTYLDSLTEHYDIPKVSWTK